MAKLKIIHEDGSTAQITEFNWKKLGKNKRGWSIQGAQGAQEAAPKAKTAEEIAVDAEYDTTMEKLKGLHKDGKFLEALPLAQKAYALKPSPYVKRFVNECTNRKAQYEEAMKTAKSSEDLTVRLELFKAAAAASIDTQEVKNLIAQTEEAIKNKSVEDELL